MVSWSGTFCYRYQRSSPHKPRGNQHPPLLPVPLIQKAGPIPNLSKYNIDNALGDPILQAEYDMIRIVYLFLLRLGEYTVSKQKNTPLRLE